jgi:integrase
MVRRRGAHEGTIFQRTDGRWCGTLSLGWKDGKRRRKYFCGTTAEGVRKLLTAQRGKLDQGEQIDVAATAITLASFAARWLANIAPDLKPRTVQSYRWLLDTYALPSLGAKKLHAISRVDLKRLLTAKRQSGLAKNTVRLIRACLSGLFAEAVDEGLITNSPVVGLSRRERRNRADTLTLAERTKAVRPFTAEELQAFLTALRQVEPDAYPLFLTLARTGLRPGEAFALKWDDLNFRRREILVERALSAGVVGATKTGNARRVDMSQDLTAALNHLLVERAQAGSPTAGANCRNGSSPTLPVHPSSNAVCADSLPAP